MQMSQGGIRLWLVPCASINNRQPERRATSGIQVTHITRPGQNIPNKLKIISGKCEKQRISDIIHFSVLD